MEDINSVDNVLVKLWIENFARFRAEIRRIFRPSNKVNVAIRII